MMTRENVLTSTSIQQAMTRSISCLRMNFRTLESGGGGWYHYFDDPRPGVTASAAALYCFHLAGADFAHADEVIEFLLGKQDHGEGPERGGWAVRTTYGVPLVEATAWVLRSLGALNVGSLRNHDAIANGMEWLERNQNSDFGWGSYLGQPSRVYTTTQAILALAQCGGSRTAISNAQNWLNSAQSPNIAAWGALPGGKPTMLHTSMALMAQLAFPGSLPPAAIRQSVDWLTERISPAEFTEKATAVEDYDVPYVQNGIGETFQNSLPHFAGPMALTAILAAGSDPFQSKIFEAAQAMIDAQEKDDPVRSGTWELPRSPERPSIWALWPFISALTAVRQSVLPGLGRSLGGDESVTLLYQGCGVIQTNAAPRHLTLRLLLRNALVDWVRRRALAIAIWAVVMVLVGIAVGLWVAGELDLQTFLLALVLPVLLVLFQILWDRRNR
jgi:hypothetical protein